jgi:thymus-specific serine protease
MLPDVKTSDWKELRFP